MRSESHHRNPQDFAAVRAAHPRRGYSLIETMVASILAALLGILAGALVRIVRAVRTRSRVRARIAQEGILAAQSLACDFGGFLADAPGRTGTLAQYSFTSWDISQGKRAHPLLSRDDPHAT